MCVKRRSCCGSNLRPSICGFRRGGLHTARLAGWYGLRTAIWTLLSMANSSFQTSNGMSIYKRGRYYWYSFWFRGNRVQCGTKSTSNRVASKLESLHKARLIEGKQSLTPAKEIPKFSEFTE